MRHCRLFLVCLVACAAAGCVGYKLGPTGPIPAGGKTIQVNPFSNQTFEPRFGDALTEALRRELQQDGTYRLSTRGGADVIVNGSLIRYTRRELSLVPRDVLTVRDFQVLGVAQVTAVESGTGRVLLNRPVTGNTLVRVGADLASAERQALPMLAEDIARQIKDLLVDGEW